MKKKPKKKDGERALFIRLKGKGYMVAQVNDNLIAVPEKGKDVTGPELDYLMRYLEEEGWYSSYFDKQDGEGAGTVDFW